LNVRNAAKGLTSKPHRSAKAFCVLTAGPRLTLKIIIGYVSIFLGLLWVIWPQLLRGWAVSRASWALFWLLLSLFFSPLAAWAKQWDMNGWICAVITFLIVGSVLRNLIGKAAQKIPLLYFRLAGLLSILSGLYLIFLMK
jgi:hypothetical protein